MSPEESSEEPENLTRKQRREQAREQRKAAEEAEASASARRRRLMQLGGVLVAVVVVIVVIVVATSGKGSNAVQPIPKTKAAKNEAVHAVSSLLNGIPQEGRTLGNPKAPVTLVYFGDLECPICQEFSLEALPGIVTSSVRPGKLKIEYKSLSTATGTAESEGAEPSGTFASQQLAAYAAGKQNLAWNFIETFYHEQGKEDSGYVNEAYIQGIAQQIPELDLKQWQADRGDKALEIQMIEEEREANRIGFTGTPSFLIGKTGSKLKPFEPSSLKESSAFEGEINKLAS